MKLAASNHNEVRRWVFEMALVGRATYLPAGARDNATALILVDGETVGQMSSLGHFVREEGGKVYGEQKLLPNYPAWLPDDLRAMLPVEVPR